MAKSWWRRSDVRRRYRGGGTEAPPAAERREVFNRHELPQESWEEEVRLDANKIGNVRCAPRRCHPLLCAWRHGDGSALPMLAQSGNLSLVIWSWADVG